MDYGLKIANWRKQHPEQMKAAKLFHQALRKNEIKKPECCEICGEHRRLNGHHWNYDKPLEVTWLCYSCHKNIHNYLRKVKKNEINA